MIGTLSSSREGETCRVNSKWYDKGLQRQIECKEGKLTCKEGRISTEVRPDASVFSLSCNSAGNDVGKSLFPPKLNWNGASVLEVNITYNYRCSMVVGRCVAPALCGLGWCGKTTSHKALKKYRQARLAFKDFRKLNVVGQSPSERQEVLTR